MPDYFDNRRSDAGSSQQHLSWRNRFRRDIKLILKPGSRRGSKLRFRILCLLAFLFVVFFLLIRHLAPLQSSPSFDGLIEKDILNKENKSTRKLLLNRES